MNKKAKRRERHKKLLEEGNLQNRKMVYIAGSFDCFLKDFAPEKESTIEVGGSVNWTRRYGLPKEVIEDYKWIKKHFNKMGIVIIEEELKGTIQRFFLDVDKNLLSSFLIKELEQ